MSYNFKKMNIESFKEESNKRIDKFEKKFNKVISDKYFNIDKTGLYNAAIVYNNKIMSFVQEFEKCGLDFFDNVLSTIIISDMLNYLSFCEDRLNEYCVSYYLRFLRFTDVLLEPDVDISFYKIFTNIIFEYEIKDRIAAATLKYCNQLTNSKSFFNNIDEFKNEISSSLSALGMDSAIADCLKVLDIAYQSVCEYGRCEGFIYSEKYREDEFIKEINESHKINI